MSAKSTKMILEQRLAENTNAHNSKQEELPDFLTPRKKAVEQLIEARTKGALLRAVRVVLVDRNPWQPRTYFPEDEIHDLAASITEIGLIQPIVVRVMPDGRFQLVAGERRLRAHVVLGKDDISALVVEVTDEEMALMALAENLDREDLSDYEIGKAIRRAELEFPSRKKMAEALGIARQDLYRYLAFDSLPDHVKSDLEVNPRLLGRSAAESVKQMLAKLKDEPSARQAFDLAWERLKDGTLDQTALAAAIARAARVAAGHAPAREVRRLFAGGAQAGTVTKDWKALTIRVKNGALDEDAERRLVEFLKELFPSSE